MINKKISNFLKLNYLKKYCIEFYNFFLFKKYRFNKFIILFLALYLIYLALYKFLKSVHNNMVLYCSSELFSDKVYKIKVKKHN